MSRSPPPRSDKLCSAFRRAIEPTAVASLRSVIDVCMDLVVSMTAMPLRRSPDPRIRTAVSGTHPSPKRFSWSQRKCRSAWD